jgi:coenzyme F420-reducing hydrogenase beta subunit
MKKVFFTLYHCIDCGLCEKVCPSINQRKQRKPFYVYAAKNKNERIRKESSSGGIFTLLAEQIIKENGVVFGARFNENWEVMHDYVETKEGLALFRGSKYVQSRIGNTYQQVEQFLKTDRQVLFSGTPCQVAGLKLFLQKEYNNLLTICLPWCALT